MLKTLFLPPLDAIPLRDRAIVALHGWGANAADLMFLAECLDLPDCQYAFPEAPFPHPTVLEGCAWYDLQDPSYRGIEEARQRLREFLENLPERTHIALENTILLGFSQGGAMTLDVGASLPLAGLVSLSGYLHPGARSRTYPPTLIAHGRWDPVVPIAAARAIRDALESAGAPVTYAEYDMGHEILPETIERVREFVCTCFAAANREGDEIGDNREG